MWICILTLLVSKIDNFLNNFVWFVFVIPLDVIMESIIGLTLLLFILFIITICTCPRRTCNELCKQVPISQMSRNSTSLVKASAASNGKIIKSVKSSTSTGYAKKRGDTSAIYKTCILDSTVIKKMSSKNRWFISNKNYFW